MRNFCHDANAIVVAKDQIVAIVITHEDLSKHPCNVGYLINLLALSSNVTPTRLKFVINSLVNLGLFE